VWETKVSVGSTYAGLILVVACSELLDEHRILVEPACSASYSAISIGHPLVDQAKSIVVIICGGSGMTSDMLREWKRTHM